MTPQQYEFVPSEYERYKARRAKAFAEEVAAVKAQLNTWAREEFVLALRHRYTLDEIGDVLDLTHERIHQIEKQARRRREQERLVEFQSIAARLMLYAEALRVALRRPEGVE